MISLTPSFAECQTFGLWKTIGLYAGMNGSYYYLIESLALHCLNFSKRMCLVEEIISGQEIKTNFGD